MKVCGSAALVATCPIVASCCWLQVFKSLAPIFTTVLSMCYLNAVFPYSAVAAVRGAGAPLILRACPGDAKLVGSHLDPVLHAGDAACRRRHSVQLEHAWVQVRARQLFPVCWVCVSLSTSCAHHLFAHATG